MVDLAAVFVGFIIHLSMANIAYDFILATVNRGAKVMARKGHTEEEIADHVAAQRQGLFAVCMFWPITFVTLAYVYYQARADIIE